MNVAVLHLRYTARRDEMLAGPALAALQTELDTAGRGTLFRFFSLRHEFPNEWQRLRTAGTHAAMIMVAKDRFPLLAQSGAVTVTELHFALILKEPRPALAYKATLTPGGGAPIDLGWPAQAGRYRSGAKAKAVTISIEARPEDNGWRLQLTAPTGSADLDRMRDILLVARYSVAM